MVAAIFLCKKPKRSLVGSAAFVAPVDVASQRYESAVQSVLELVTERCVFFHISFSLLFWIKRDDGYSEVSVFEKTEDR